MEILVVCLILLSLLTETVYFIKIARRDKMFYEEIKQITTREDKYKKYRNPDGLLGKRKDLRK
jgi:hypothetical protein